MARPSSAWGGRAGALGVATSALSALALLVPAALAPPAPRAPGLALGTLLLVSAGTHVAATPWLGSLRPVRACVREDRVGLVLVPLGLAALGVLGSALLPATAFGVVLLGFFAWQLHHFAKQNVGVVALSASAAGVPGPSRKERRWVLASSTAGILGLVARPGLVEVPLPSSAWLTPIARLGFAVAVLGGLVELARRPRDARPPGLVAATTVAVCFSAPIFVATSPYGAVAGMTIAHGLQYLGLLGLVAAGPLAAPRRRARLVALVAVAILGGAALHVAARHDAGSGLGRLAFGAYLGCYAAHFAVDARLWRLSVPASRRFVAAALPGIVRHAPAPAPLAEAPRR